MIEVPFALAFAAGFIATMNPCGFAMLPAYLSYFMGRSEDAALSRVAALRRALLVGGVMSVSFVLVFGVTGLAITAGFRAVIDWIPYIALTIGVFIAVLGLAMLFGYELRVGLPKAKSASKDKGLRSVFLFGLSYGAASLSCTLPVFLSVVAAQLTASSFVSGAATFVVYGLGMSMMLMGITLVLAFGKQTLVGKLRNSVRYINRISGAVLLVAGAYIVWFWATNISQGADALNNSGAFRFTETLSQRATVLFGDHASVWALIFGGLIVATLAYALRSPGGGPGGSTRPAARLRQTLLGGTAVAGIAALVAGVGIFAASPFSGSGSAPVAAGVSAASAPRGPLAPTAAFSLFDGSSAAFADYRGRPLVVNFWASWCPACVAELSAAIVPVQATFGDSVAWVGVNLTDERPDALKLVDETGVQFDLAEDPVGSLYRNFGGFSMPFTAFISADGQILDEHNGALTEGELEGKIQELFLDADGEVLAASDDGQKASAGTAPAASQPATSE